METVTWQADTAYLEGLDFFSAVVERFPADGWDRASPCSGWRALDVLGHVGATTRYGIEVLRGGTPSWQPSATPGDSVEGEPVAWWEAIVGEARPLVRTAELEKEVDTARGRRSVAEGLSLPAVDLFVHGWDLARSAGESVEIPGEAIEFARPVLEGIPPELMRTAAAFSAAVEPPEGATPSEAFLAWCGRLPRG